MKISEILWRGLITVERSEGEFEAKFLWRSDLKYDMSPIIIAPPQPSSSRGQTDRSSLSTNTGVRPH